MQTETSNKTAEECYHLSIITSYCEIPFSSQHSVLHTNSGIPVLQATFHNPYTTSQTQCMYQRDDSQTGGRPVQFRVSSGALSLCCEANQG